ncbi:MAG: undecaprenyl-diphosphate phosphatase [Rhodobacteraceae bacterium]|nr:undecaprenyl-diphosphate phosphatase [Paracoccaceae bacterium]
MDLLNLLLIAIIQGITEFLPISSSAHLILFPALTGTEDQGLVIDAAVHVGTLAAVMVFFRSETARLARGTAQLARGRTGGADARLALLMALATIPVVVVGAALAISGLIEEMRSVRLIAWMTIIWAIFLYLADRFGPRVRTLPDWSLRHAVVMGLVQALSLVPGTSRSGATMTAARAMGFDRVEAARISLLMSIPAVAAVGAWIVIGIIRQGDVALGLDAAMAAVLAFGAALLALAFLMRMVRDWSFTPFVIYRLVLGGLLLWIA